jgi:hypothetical protein
MTARPHSPAFPLLSDFDRQGQSDEPDHESQVRTAFEEGYQQGVADGRVEAEADCQHRLAEAESLHATQLGNEREAWQRDFADLLAGRFESSVKSITRSIEERVAALLQPWLIEHLHERALRDLENAIARSLSAGAKIHIEAPADILARLRERLPAGAFEIGYSESDTPDIRAHIDDTRIEANVSDWISQLEAAA